MKFTRSDIIIWALSMAFLAAICVIVWQGGQIRQQPKGDCHEAAVAWRHATVYDLRALTSIANYGATEQAAVDIHTATGWVDIAQAANCPGAK